MNENLRRFGLPIAQAAMARAQARLMAVNAMRVTAQTDVFRVTRQDLEERGVANISPKMAALLFLGNSPITEEWLQTGKVTPREVNTPHRPPLAYVLYHLSVADLATQIPFEEALKRDYVIFINHPLAPQDLILSLAGYVDHRACSMSFVSYRDADFLSKESFPRMLFPKEVVLDSNQGSLAERYEHPDFPLAFATMFRYFTTAEITDPSIDPNEPPSDKAARFLTRPESFFGNSLPALVNLANFALIIDHYQHRGFDEDKLQTLMDYLKKLTRIRTPQPKQLERIVACAFERAFDWQSKRLDEDYYHSFDRDDKGKLKKQCRDISLAMLGINQRLSDEFFDLLSK